MLGSWPAKAERVGRAGRSICEQPEETKLDTRDATDESQLAAHERRQEHASAGLPLDAESKTHSVAHVPRPAHKFACSAANKPCAASGLGAVGISGGCEHPDSTKLPTAATIFRSQAAREQ